MQWKLSTLRLSVADRPVPPAQHFARRQDYERWFWSEKNFRGKRFVAIASIPRAGRSWKNSSSPSKFGIPRTLCSTWWNLFPSADRSCASIFHRAIEPRLRSSAAFSTIFSLIGRAHSEPKFAMKQPWSRSIGPPQKIGRSTSFEKHSRRESLSERTDAIRPWRGCVTFCRVPSENALRYKRTFRYRKVLEIASCCSFYRKDIPARRR